MNPQLEEIACLYVLDRLDPRERASFEACLRHNPQLASFVREIASTLDQGIRALPQVEPPAGLLAQIEARIAELPAEEAIPTWHRRPASGSEQPSDMGETPMPPQTIAKWHGRPAGRSARAEAGPARGPETSSNMGGKPTPLWITIARWGIAALIAVGVVTLAVQHLWRAPAAAGRPFVIIVGLDSRRSTLTELPLQKLPPDADASFVQLASLAEQFWEKPEDLPVKLRATGQGGRGYALFDPASSQGFVAVQQLPVIGHGQRYHLWMLDTVSGLIREAGVLPVTGSNSGLYSFSVVPISEAKPDRVDFFVTAEDTASPESTRPSGRVVLGSQRTF